MKNLCLVLLCFLMSSTAFAQASAERPIALVIHGGAGTIERSLMSPEREAAYHAALREALEAGYAILERGGTALDAVIASVQSMENSPLFNAGVGAVLTNTGVAELDAAIMEGATRNAGAVASVRTVKSPIALARTVMEASPHVLLIRDGAETFAQEQGLDLVENDYFITDRQREALRRLQNRQGAGPFPPLDPESILQQKLGTVGAVALDREGNIAAGTSTGGMMGKRWGRVGDVPIIGAGTYADNETAGISATGHGEYFIRSVVAHDVASMMRYGGLSLDEAARRAIFDHMGGMGGTGGLVALNRAGEISMPFNTSGMYRGYVDRFGTRFTAIYGE